MESIIKNYKIKQSKLKLKISKANYENKVFIISELKKENKQSEL
jgi:hypothetical protein